MAYLGNGIYDLLDVVRASNNPQINYEGLYQDASAPMATSSLLQSMKPGYEFRNDSYMRNAYMNEGDDLSGNISTDYNRRLDFKNYFNNQPLRSNYESLARFENFNPRIGMNNQLQETNVPTTFVPSEISIKETPQVFNSQADYGQFFRPQPVVDRNLFTPVMEKFAAARQGLGSLKDRAMDFGTKGIDLGKMVGRGILNAVIPGAGLFIDAFKTTPEGTAMKDFYGNLYGLDPIGRIASGPMKGYAPGDTLFGSPGLTNSINQRIARIKKTLEKKKSVQLEQRLKALEELKKKESEISSQVLESKRTGRRPSAPSGGGGVRDSGGPTGGYSYDAGGREGFGYGLKNGGIVDLL
jgi:hypothetical protein